MKSKRMFVGSRRVTWLFTLLVFVYALKVLSNTICWQFVCYLNTIFKGNVSPQLWDFKARTCLQVVCGCVCSRTLVYLWSTETCSARQTPAAVIRDLHTVMLLKGCRSSWQREREGELRKERLRVRKREKEWRTSWRKRKERVADTWQELTDKWRKEWTERRRNGKCFFEMDS